MLDTVEINHVQHISFTQSRLTDAVSVILSELLSYEHPSKTAGRFFVQRRRRALGGAFHANAAGHSIARPPDHLLRKLPGGLRNDFKSPTFLAKSDEN